MESVSATQPVAPAKRQPQGWVEIYRQLQTEILVGRLRPRERLVEDDLIVRYDATRHAIRRALDELQNDGLVIRQPNRGVHVRDYTRKEVEDLYEIRTSLEDLAARNMRLPASAAFVEELRTMAGHHQEASRSGDYLEFSRLNNAFHELLYSGAKNPELSKAIKHYSVMTQPIRTRGFPDLDLRETAIREHWAMIAAIESRQTDDLACLCRDHIRRPKDFYLGTAGPADFMNAVDTGDGSAHRAAVAGGTTNLDKPPVTKG